MQEKRIVKCSKPANNNDKKMQTKQQIQTLLLSSGLRPNTRLGQHFLIDLNLIRLLLDSARIHPNDIVLEIGPGTGSMTEALALQAGKVIAVEIDNALAQILNQLFAETYNVQIINIDALENKNRISHEVTDAISAAREELSGRLMLVANLPYNVAASVMMNLVTGPTTAEAMYVTVQKEVAQRMAAAPATSDYGILSIILNATGNVKMIRTLRPSVFWPRPQVDSAMISYTRDQEKIDRIHNMKSFKAVISLFMTHRRKMLQACVKFAQPPLDKIHNWHDIFDRAFVEPHHRPEELTSEEYIAIANLG